jgi:tRNA dimethylallyltransferase
MKSSYDIITIIGPTASGKTQFAAALAANIDAEIISADSRQVYRRMDLGTGKDLADYTVNGYNVPYHLIDIVEPGTKYDLFTYQQDFLEAYKDICSRGKKVILCGGSGLYVESILRAYNLSPVPQNPELRARLEGKSLSELEEILRSYPVKLHNTTDVDTAARAIRAIEIADYEQTHPVADRPFPTLSSLTIGVDVSREVRRERISNRLESRIQEGMLDEIRGLLNEGITPEQLIYYGLEYKFLTEHIIGVTTYDEMLKSLEIAIHQFAKRQMTWFRGMERRGVPIHWIDGTLTTEAKIEAVRKLMQLDN